MQASITMYSSNMPQCLLAHIVILQGNFQTHLDPCEGPLRQHVHEWSMIGSIPIWQCLVHLSSLSLARCPWEKCICPKHNENTNENEESFGITGFIWKRQIWHEKQEIHWNIWFIQNSYQSIWSKKTTQNNHICHIFPSIVPKSQISLTFHQV